MIRERGKSESRSKASDPRAKELLEKQEKESAKLKERQEKEAAKLRERQEKLEKEQLRQKELERRKKEAKIKERHKPSDPRPGGIATNPDQTLPIQNPMPMSPTPHRKRWDKNRINTDLAHEDTDDDLNPKPDKVGT